MVEAITITIPQETVNDETVRILAWKFPSGSRVEKDQLLCEVETSKAVMEIHASGSGILRYAAALGEEVPVGSTICEIIPETQVPAGVRPDVRRDAECLPASPTKKTNGTAPVGRPARLTPLARTVAAECGVDAAAFPPGSLIRSADVLREAGKAVPKSKTARKIRAPALERGSGEDDGPPANVPAVDVPVTWSDLPRRKILEGRLLRTGQAACIQSLVTLVCRAPKLRSRLERLGFSAVGLNALAVFEVSRLLRKYPMFNALHDRGRIGQYGQVNIGWAIDGGHDLVVPVVKQADNMSLREIAAEMDRHIEAYVSSSLTSRDLAGGTFTVSDLSADGISLFNPLISQGQTAILGVGADAAGKDGECFFLNLAFDHQVAEGRSAAQFLRDLSGRLEAYSDLERNWNGTSDSSGKDLFCVVCQRDESTLRSIKAILVKSEMPPGRVCSVCLAGC